MFILKMVFKKSKSNRPKLKLHSITSCLSSCHAFFQYYFYEFDEEGDDLHVKRPRQCLPYALLTFNIVDSSAPPQEPSVLQVSCQCVPRVLGKCQALAKKLANYISELSANPEVILV